jgi:glycosyltransferase involved in cell wall biosynthesis
MPKVLRALFSGTYNDYYDLKLSSLFMEELRGQIRVETHWARPLESNKSRIGVGEEEVLFVEQTEMANLIPNYSFGVSICKLDAGPSLTAAMPTKIGEFLACGRPIVINKGLGDMDEFIAESKVGVTLNGDPGNARDAATELIELVSDPETPFRCRAIAEKYFSMDNGVEKYLDLYARMLTN